MDTFPGLQADALQLIQKANNLILLARQLRADATRGDAEAVKQICKEIGEAGPRVTELCDGFRATAQHFVTYADGDAA